LTFMQIKDSKAFQMKIYASILLKFWKHQNDDFYHCQFWHRLHHLFTIAIGVFYE